MANDLLLNSDGRVFIATSGIGCGRTYGYYSCMKITGLQKNFGDIESFYCPDPDKPGEFEEVATIQGAESRWTATITGPKVRASRSSIGSLLQRKNCEFNAQVHFGRCIDPSQFNEFESIVIIEGARISEYSTDDLVALNPGERAIIQETLSLSARSIYEIYEQAMYEEAQAQANIAGYIVPSIAYSTYVDCDDDCPVYCQRYYAVRIPFTAAGGCSPADLLYTEDGGYTWTTLQIGTLCLLNQNIESYEIVAAGSNLYFTYNFASGFGGITIIPQSMISDGAITNPTNVQLAFTIYDSFYADGVLWVVGGTGLTAGYISAMDTVTQVVTSYETGVNFLRQFYSVYSYDSDNVIAGGAVGTLAARLNGSSFQAISVIVNGLPVGDDIIEVWMKSKTNWYIGTTVGDLYCTLDSGKTWTQSGDFAGCIGGLTFPTDNVGYVAVGYPASVWRTIDGGSTWTEVDDTYNQLPTDVILSDIASCPSDPNTFIAVGRETATTICSATGGSQLAGDSGFVIVGRPSSG